MPILVAEIIEVGQMKHRGWKEWSAFGHFVAELHESLAWQEKALLISQAVRHNGEDYTLVLTAVKNKQKVVAFFNGESPILCYTNLYRHLFYGKIPWIRSKY